MPHRTLYDYAMAPSPRRSRIFLAEKGIAHETVLVDIGAGEQFSDGFKAINPRCTVPALMLDSGDVLTDTAAIHAWAEAVQPDPPLMGTTPLEKADIASWNARIESEGFMAIAEAFRNAVPSMKDRAFPGPVPVPQIEALIERGKTRFGQFLGTLEQHLVGRDYVAAGQFSLADISAVVTIDFSRIIKMTPGDAHPNIKRWHAAMKERPSFSL